MAKRLAKILTTVAVLMFIALIAMLWDMDRIRPNPMGNPEFRLMMMVVKPWIITATVVLLLGCGLFSMSVSRRNAVISGGNLSTLSVLFALTMSTFVSVHSWTAIFLLFGALGCIAAVIFLLAAVGRYIADLMRSTQ